MLEESPFLKHGPAIAVALLTNERQRKQSIQQRGQRAANGAAVKLLRAHLGGHCGQQRAERPGELELPVPGLVDDHPRDPCRCAPHGLFSEPFHRAVSCTIRRTEKHEHSKPSKAAVNCNASLGSKLALPLKSSDALTTGRNAAWRLSARGCKRKLPRGRTEVPPADGQHERGPAVLVRQAEGRAGRSGDAT